MMTSSDRHGNTKTKTTSMRMSLVAALILVLGGGFLLATLTMQQPQHRLLQRSHEHDDITGEDNFRLSLHGGHDGDADDDDDDAIAKDHKRQLGWNPNKEIKKWKDKVKNLEGDLKNKQQEVNDKQNHINNLNGQLNTKKTELTNLGKEVDRQKDLVSSKQTELENKIAKFTDLEKDLTDQVTASLEEVQEKLDEIVGLDERLKAWVTQSNYWNNKANNFETTLDQVKKELYSQQRKVRWMRNKITAFGVQVTKLQDKITSTAKVLEDKVVQVADLQGKIASTAEVLKDKVLSKLDDAQDELDKVFGPIESKLDRALDEQPLLNNIAKSVADGAMVAIKSLDFLPKNGDVLAEGLVKAMEAFFPDYNCIPYSCLAKILAGIDIGNVELFSSDTLKISTAVTPTTCLQLSSIEFDVDKLGEFLDLFRDSKALGEIYNKVRDYLVTEIGETVLYTDEIGVQIRDILDDIQDVAEGAIDALSLGRRRHLTVTEDVADVANGASDALSLVGRRHLTVTPGDIADMATMAYEKGTAEFKRLYEDHISSVFQELELNPVQNAESYIMFKSLKFKLTQDLSQTFNLEAQGRAGFAGSTFDESFHQPPIRFPIPQTFGAGWIVVSGSMEGSMPYAMTAEGSGTAEFRYGMGKATMAVDMLTGKVTTEKQPSTSTLDVEAQVGVSATMALNFAASTTLGICLGPSESACIKVKIDLSQSSAAGFDALATVGTDTNLTPLYTDVLEYDDEVCDGGTLSLSAGYWAYVKAPSATVTVLRELGCSSASDILFQYGGGLAAQSIDNFCVSI